MSHIIDPKTEKEFPTYVEFAARIEAYKNDLVVVGVCRHCGGKVGGHVKVRKLAQRYTEEQINQLALEYLKKHHNCPRKIASWGDKSLLHKIGADIMRGYDKLKELEIVKKVKGLPPGRA